MKFKILFWIIGLFLVINIPNAFAAYVDGVTVNVTQNEIMCKIGNNSMQDTMIQWDAPDTTSDNDNFRIANVTTPRRETAHIQNRLNSTMFPYNGSLRTNMMELYLIGRIAGMDTGTTGRFSVHLVKQINGVNGTMAEGVSTFNTENPCVGMTTSDTYSAFEQAGACNQTPEDTITITDAQLNTNRTWNVTRGGNYAIINNSGNITFAIVVTAGTSATFNSKDQANQDTKQPWCLNATWIVTQVAAAADTTKPKINMTFNQSTIRIRDAINFTLNGTEETAFSWALLLNNQTGKMSNQTIELPASRTDFLANFTVNITASRGTVINFTGFFNDTSNNIIQNSTLMTVDDTLGTITILGLNATTFFVKSRINISANVTDADADINATVIAHNQSGIQQTNVTFNKDGGFLLAGTKINSSTAVTITLTQGNVINFTFYYNNSDGDLSQESTKITISDTPITFGNFINVSDLTYNKNQSINWSCSDADSPPDAITSNAYFDTIDPPKVQIASDVVDYNITTNMTVDGKYFLNATCTSGGTTTYSTIFNISLDVSTPTIAGVPQNGTVYGASSNNITNFSITLTDNIQLFEGNATLFSFAGAILNTTNKTNITATTFLLNFSLNHSQIPEGYYNLTFWAGDTKNANLPIEFVNFGFDGVRQQFNDTRNKNQINLTLGLWLPNNAFLTISENDLVFGKKSAIISKLNSNDKVEHFETEYNVTLPSLLGLKLMNSLLNYLNIQFAIQIKANHPITEINDGLSNHLLIGAGKERLSFDAEDLREQGFTATINKSGSAYYLLINPKNSSYASGMKLSFDPRIDNLNIVEQSIIIGIDKTNPTLNAFNLSGIRNNTFTSNPMINFTVNASDLFLNSTRLYINDVIQNNTGIITNSTNATIMMNLTKNGNYTFKMEVSDLAGYKSNFSYFYSLSLDTSPSSGISAPSISGGGAGGGGASSSSVSQNYIKNLETLQKQCNIEVSPLKLIFNKDNEKSQIIIIKNFNPVITKFSSEFVNEVNITPATDTLNKNFESGDLLGGINISVYVKDEDFSKNKFSSLKLNFENCAIENTNIPIYIEKNNDENGFNALSFVSLDSLKIPSLDSLKAFINKDIIKDLKIPFIEKTIDLKNYIVLSVIFIISLTAFFISLTPFFAISLFVVINFILNFVINLFV